MEFGQHGFRSVPLADRRGDGGAQQHGARELKARYLPKLVSGEWTGTMNLTEPQAGSDLSAVRTKAVPEGDHYRLYGQKIFITWGRPRYDGQRRPPGAGTYP